MKLTETKRREKIRNLFGLDHQYYFNDKDRVELSKMSDMARNDTLKKRMEMIEKKSEVMKMSYKVQQEAK